MKNINLTIYGNPVPKGRSKFAVIKGHAIAYTPKKTRVDEENLRAQMLPYRPESPLQGALSLMLLIYRSIPKSFSKKRQKLAEAGHISPITRPDIDNYLKQCVDAMSGIFFRDDSQICQVTLAKWYSDRPRIQVSISQIQEEREE